METKNKIENKNPAIGSETLKADEFNALSFELRNSHPKQAMQNAEEALTLSKKINYRKGEADAFSNIGFLFIHEAKNEDALTFLIDALSIYEKLNDENGIGNAQYNLGVLNVRIGNFDQAINFLHKSLAIREKQNDKSGLAACYFQLTYLNRHFNDDESAFENANRAVALRKEINDTAGLAAALMVLGDVYFKRNDLASAKELFAQSLELRKISKERIGYFVSLVRWADLHIALKEFDKAREFCEFGIKNATEDGIKFGVLRFKQTLGKIELAQNNLQKACNIYSDALKYAEEYSFKSIEYELLAAMTEVLKAQGKHKEALEHYEKYHKIKEEVVSMQNNSQLKTVTLINQIEFARKEAELEKTKNAQLQEAYQIIELKNKDITDSIRYAKRIQTSLLPTEIYIERVLKMMEEKEFE